jgi:predicted dehydrogenase
MEKGDVDDVAFLPLALKNGAVGTVEASRLSPGSLDELKIEIQGQGGALRFNLMDLSFITMMRGKKTSLSEEKKVSHELHVCSAIQTQISRPARGHLQDGSVFIWKASIDLLCQ